MGNVCHKSIKKTANALLLLSHCAVVCSFPSYHFRTRRLFPPALIGMSHNHLLITSLTPPATDEVHQPTARWRFFPRIASSRFSHFARPHFTRRQGNVNTRQVVACIFLRFFLWPKWLQRCNFYVINTRIAIIAGFTTVRATKNGQPSAESQSTRFVYTRMPSCHRIFSM